jgi:hypothetical protein
MYRSVAAVPRGTRSLGEQSINQSINQKGALMTLDGGPRHIYRPQLSRNAARQPDPPAAEGPVHSGPLARPSSPAAGTGAGGPLAALAHKPAAAASTSAPRETSLPPRAQAFAGQAPIRTVEQARARLRSLSSPLTSLADCHRLLDDLDDLHEAGGIDAETHRQLADGLKQTVPIFNRASEAAWQAAMDTVLTATSAGAGGEEALQQAVTQAAARPPDHRLCRPEPFARPGHAGRQPCRAGLN